MQVEVVYAADSSAAYSVDEKQNDIGLLGKNVKDARDLVAIIVDQDVWNSDLQKKIERYAEDVQKALPRTNTLIVPVDTSAQTVLKLQQVLEKLYLEGRNSAQLVGVVIVGEVPLPVVTKGSQSFISLLPYTDFVEPTYVFNADLQEFVLSSSAPPDPKPEVWHGVIRAPLSGVDGEKQLASYFDKNHLYHTGDPAFKNFGKKILYSDLAHESANVSSTSFPRYQSYLKDMEDMVYHRFSAKWLAALQKDTGAADVKPIGQTTPASLTGMPDIQTVQPIQQLHLSYPEIFGTFLNTVTDLVVGSGRWTEDDVDTLPALIAKKDAMTMSVLKTANDEIEAKVDSELEKVQQPLPLYHDVLISGFVRQKQPPTTGLLNMMSDFFFGKKSYKVFAIGTTGTIDGEPSKGYLFNNNSIFDGKQFVNGVDASDIVRAQQCSTYGGSVTTGTAKLSSAVSQMAQFLRALNPLTVHISGGDGTDPQALPSLGVTTRSLTADEASSLSGGNILHGAVVEKVFATPPTPAVPAQFANMAAELSKKFTFEKGDILLDVDGATIDDEHPVDILISDKNVGDKIHVGTYRGGENLNIESTLIDANADSLVAGCFGVNMTADRKARCLPLAATYPIADHGGTAPVDSIAGLNRMDLGLSCTSFRPKVLFDGFMKSANTFFGDATSTTPPALPSQDPAQVFLVGQKDVKTSARFTFQDFLNLQGIMNQQDDNGDYVDTNKNGAVDQIAWVDYNRNGKLDLWVNPSFTGDNSVNVINPPGDPNKFPKNLDISPEAFNAKFPQFFQGSKYIGPYTGEFVGGDFGVDDPSEVGFGYKAVGENDSARWDNIQKKYLEIAQPTMYATPRHTPTQKEYRSYVMSMVASHPKSKTSDFNLAYPYSACVNDGTGCTDDSPKVYEMLRLGSSDIWMNITSKKEKDISSLSLHKEPTPETLAAQFKAVMSVTLPIDKPRHATFIDKSGSPKKFIYPNAFEAQSIDDLTGQLTDAEKTLATFGSQSTGLLSGLFSADESKKIASFLEWRHLSLEEKHARAMQEYLNPAIDSYIDDSPSGYEAMYFVANGKSTYYTTDFSGEALLNENDAEYMHTAQGIDVQGQSTAQGAAVKALTTKKLSAAEQENFWGKDTSPTDPGDKEDDKALDADSVDLFKWPAAIAKWVNNLKNAFKPLGLSVTKAPGKGGYDDLVKDAEPVQTLKLSIPKKDIFTNGESITVDVLGFNAKGAVAADDHTSVVRLDVTGLDNTQESAKITPAAADMSEAEIGGSFQKGIFLNDGKASFQIIPGTKLQTLVVRARGYNGKEIMSDSATLKVADQTFPADSNPITGSTEEKTSTSISADNSVLLGGTSPQPQAVQITTLDASGKRVEGVALPYSITVSGPATISGITDTDSARDGIQVSSLGEPVKLFLTPTATSGQVTVSVSTEGIESDAQGNSITTTKSLTIPIRSDLSLHILSSATQLKADETAQATITATVTDAKGNTIPDYSGPVQFSVDNTGTLGIASKIPSQFTAGKAFITVQSGKRSGVAHVNVSSSGLISASTSVTVVPLDPVALQVVGGAKNLGPKASTNLIINVIDKNGNLTTGSSVPLQARITSVTQKFGDLPLTNGALTKQIATSTKNGVGIITVKAGDISGPIHLVISSPNLTLTTFEILGSGMTGIGQVSGFDPSVLYASILGAPFGKVTEQNYLAGAMLFSGKMQAASAVTTDIKPRHTLLSIGAYGSVKSYDEVAGMEVLNSGVGEPLRISISSDMGKTALGELIIKREGQASDFVKIGADAASQYSLVGDSVRKTASGKDLVRVNSFGGVEVLDSSATISVTAAGGKFMTLDVTVDGGVIATIQIPFDAVNSLSLISSSPASYALLPAGVWLVNQIHSGDFAFEPSYTGFSSEDARGYRLVSTLSTDATADDSVGSASVSLEDALDKNGIGFASDNKHMLLLAGGNTVGESHLPYASELGIILGDPTVRLTGDNPASGLGFSSDIGKSIGSIIGGAKVVLPLDVNNDGKKDLLIGNEDGSIKYFQYVGGSEVYRDRGELLRVKHGIYDAAVADIDGNGHEDILIGTKELCTTHDTCVDVYLNNGNGTFTRKNEALDIEPDRRVVVMRLVDLNADGLPDLLVSLTNGEIRVYYAISPSLGGGFEKVGQLLGSFNVSPGQKVLLMASTTIGQSVKAPAGDTAFAGDVTDSYADIFAQPEGSVNANQVYFISNAGKSLRGGHVSYRKVNIPNVTPSPESAVETLTAQLKEKFAPATKAGDANAAAKVAAGASMKLLLGENAKDADHDGIPDYLGAGIGAVSNVVGGVKNAIKALRCGKGCLPLPINFAFLAPGVINVNGVPSGYDPGLPVFGAAGTCGIIVIWPPCPYQSPTMTFRLYVSPTLTGGVGIGICVGGPYPTGSCYTFAPNISLIPSGLCKAISDSMANVINKANSFGTGTGFTSMTSGGGSSFPSTDTGTTHKNVDLLQGYKAEVNVAKNIRVPGFPGVFTEWIDGQVEEILNKLTDLPDLIIMYPDPKSFVSAVTPRMPTGKVTGYAKFLAYLNSIPLISIEPKPVNIVIPSLTKAQILKLHLNLELWLSDFLAEIERLKHVLGCGVTEAGKKPLLDVCAMLDLNVGKVFDKVNKSFRALDTYKRLPQKLMEYRMIETKYINQLINYLTTISNFTGGYIRRQQSRLGAWFNIVKDIKKILSQWQLIIDLMVKYQASCDNCKTERGSLFPMLINLFLQIPPPPIIPFPKWPDIVMDFSSIQTGVRVAWPDLTFTPKQIILPNLPTFRLDISGLLPEATLKLQIGAAFEKLIPAIPEMPNIPLLPNLPDLPPLPAFKLPDIPPAPKIPGLDFFKGVNLSLVLGTIKDLLEIVCLIKKAYIVIPENQLKTEIEQLTQRALAPPLKLDLGVKVTYPPIKYDSVDQIILRGKMKFELETDAIYNIFKGFADSLNSVTTNLVNGTNAMGKKVGDAAKKVAAPLNGSLNLKNSVPLNGNVNLNLGKKVLINPENSQVHLVAEQTFIDPKTLKTTVDENGADELDVANPSTVLRKQLIAYRDQRGSEMADLAQGIIASTGAPLSRFVAQAGESDSSGPVSGGSVRYVALGDTGGAGTNTGTGTDTSVYPQAGMQASTDQIYTDYAQSVAEPVGMFIQNPTTGNPEKLIAYTLEQNRNPILTQADVDGDGDVDMIYSFGGDLYFKENTTKKADDAFSAFDRSSPEVVGSLDSLLPVAGAVSGISFDDSQKDLVSVSWDSSVEGSPLGYELKSWSPDSGIQRRQYLLPAAAGKIPYDGDVMSTEEIADGTSQSASFSLPYGNSYFQVLPLGDGGKEGTPSPVYVLAPQICGDGDGEGPISSLPGGDQTRQVAIGKVLSMNLKGIIDAKSEIVKYYADLDISKDSNGDGDPANDRDATSTEPKIDLGPYYKEGDVNVNIFAENAGGQVSTQSFPLHVYVPDITLSQVSASEGTATGFVDPAEPNMPFALVRQRGGSSEILGDYQTDASGHFSVTGLQSAGKTVIRNIRNEIVAEYESATGKFVVVKDGYTLRASISQATYLPTVEVVDMAGAVLASTFAIPDANTDVVTDSANVEYTPVTVGAMHGVHVVDRAASDGIEFKNIPANDPQYFGGVEIVKKDAGGVVSRVALVDSSGHIFAGDSSVSIRLRGGGVSGDADMPYVYQLLVGSNVIGEMFVATNISGQPTVLDGANFTIGNAAAVSAAVKAIPVEIGVAVGSGGFADVAAGGELGQAVALLKQNGIVQGFDDNGQQTFRPGQAITRAEYTKIVLSTLCIVPRAEAYQAPATFSDVPFVQPLTWFYPFVKESFLRNLITGYLGEKTAAGLAPFKPLANISRAESAKILIEALRMLGVISLDSVTIGAGEAWYAPFMNVAQNLAPYMKTVGASSASQKYQPTSSFIVTATEAQTPNYQMNRGDFAIMAARVLKTYDCFAAARAAKQKALQDAQLKEQKAANDAAQLAAQQAFDKDRAAKFAALQAALKQKTSALQPGVYVYLPVCTSCPCASIIDHTNALLAGDQIFAILSTKDHSTIFKKSHMITLPPTTP